MVFLPLAGYAENETPLPLDAALTASGLWEMESAAFLAAHEGAGFEWVSSAKNVAQNTRKGATLFGLPVCQTLVHMSDGKVDHYTATFYNRGDMGDLRKDQYEALLQKVVAAISAHTGVEKKVRGRDNSSAVKAFGLEWITPTADFLLEYSFTRDNPAAGERYRAEFIRLEVSPKREPKSFMAEAFSTIDAPQKYDGPKQVERNAESGDVFIRGVPMVDQGEKGYCVVASVERVLRLYGVRVDSSELAQLANSSASEGTSVEAMTKSLKALTARFKIKVRTPIAFDTQKFFRFVDDYNRVARRAKENPASIARYDLGGIYSQMKPELLRETKLKSKSEFTAYQRHIKTSIDKGVPVLWSLVMGVMPDPNYRGGVGGHMRLIIGYNEKTSELIYSDSWGMGHEFKKMPMTDAFCVTTNLATVEQQ